MATDKQIASDQVVASLFFFISKKCYYDDAEDEEQNESQFLGVQVFMVRGGTKTQAIWC